MKKIKYIIATLVLFSVGNSINAQIKGNQTFSGASIASSSAFLDASVTNVINNKDFGKGMIYPRADLSTMVLSNQGTLHSTSNNPNRFDGMIVYNTATSGTAASGSTEGTLSKGFWYYDNTSTSSINAGTWRPLGGSTKENILTTETITNRQINNAQVYGIKGTFTASGTSTSVTIPAPVGITSLYGITIFKAGTNTVFSRDLYSYNITNGAAITGSPNISVVYPAGDYDYVLEYLK